MSVYGAKLARSSRSLPLMRSMLFICLQKSPVSSYLVSSMPAAPLGSFENLKRNSGGFFCAQKEQFIAEEGGRN